MIKEYGYENDASLYDDLLKETTNKATNDMFQDALCFRSGRDALRVIARDYKTQNVYLSALACSSIILPFE